MIAFVMPSDRTMTNAKIFKDIGTQTCVVCGECCDFRTADYVAAEDVDADEADADDGDVVVCHECL